MKSISEMTEAEFDAVFLPLGTGKSARDMDEAEWKAAQARLTKKRNHVSVLDVVDARTLSPEQWAQFKRRKF